MPWTKVHTDENCWWNYQRNKTVSLVASQKTDPATPETAEEPPPEETAPDLATYDDDENALEEEAWRSI